MAVLGNLDLNDPVVKAIVGARVKLLFEKPFFGTLSTRLVLVDASSWCATAATDGRRLYYNREFIKSLSMNQLLFLIGHEVLHCVYDHLGRRAGRDPKIWNMATDYLVNDTLVKDKVGNMPEGGLLDSKYTDEMSSEEIYELLKKNAVTIKMPLDHHLDDPGFGKKDEEDGDSDKDGDKDGKKKQGKGGQPKKGGDKGQQEVEVTVMGKDGPPKLTEQDLQSIRNELRAAVIQTAQTLGAGRVPAAVRRLIDQFTHPKMDWRSLLDAHIRSSVRDDYTFQRISRRSWGLNPKAVLPGMNYIEKVKASIGIDASGSMTEEMLRDILSEVKGIMITFPDFELDVWTFDTQVYNHQKFSPENIEEIHDYELRGGGGTMFECNWDYMKKEALEPHRFIMFTDGYPNGTWGDPNYVDTLFVIHGNNTIEAPFGLTAYYEPKKK